MRQKSQVHRRTGDRRSGSGRRVASAVGIILILSISLHTPPVPAQEAESGAVAAAPIPIEAIEQAEPIDFEGQVLPIFQRSCLACHNTTRAKAQLVLETPLTIARGSDAGPVVTPGDGAASLLLQVASHAIDPSMPPPDNKVNAPPLTPRQLGILKLWIDQGAGGQVKGAAKPVDWKTLPESLFAIHALDVTADGQFGACGRGNRIHVYHLPSSRLVGVLVDPTLADAETRHARDAAHRDMVHALAFSPDGHMLASGGYRVVKLWQRLRHVKKLEITADEDAGGGEKPTFTTAVSPDGRWLAVAAPDHVIHLRTLKGDAPQLKLEGHEAPVAALAFSPDSSRLCSVSPDKTARIWQVEDGASWTTVRTPVPLKAAAWLDEQRIATAGEENQIRVWQIPGEAEGDVAMVGELAGHEKPVGCLATIRMDGLRLISGSADGTARVWNVDDGEVLLRLEHGAAITAVAARPDGKRIVTAGDDKVTLLWEAPGGARIAEIKGDRYANERAVEQERLASFTSEQADLWEKTHLDASKFQDDTAAAFVAAVTERDAAAKAVEEAEEQKKAAEDGNTAAKLTADKAKKQLDETQEIRKLAVAAADQSVQLATAAEKRATALQQTSDQATAAAEPRGKELAELQDRLAAAGADLEAKKKSAEEAGEDAEKAEANRKSVKDAEAEVQRLTEASTALQKEFETLHTAAKQAATQAHAGRKLADAADATRSAAILSRAEAEASVVGADERRKKTEVAVEAAEEAVKKAEAQIKNSTKQVKNKDDRYFETAIKSRDATGTWLEARKQKLSAEGEKSRAASAFASARNAADEANKPIRAIAFGPDGRVLALGGDSRTVCTFASADGHALETYEGHETPVTAMALSASGDLVSASSDGGCIVWDTSVAWRLHQVLGTGDSSSAIEDRVTSLAFHPDGHQLATGSGRPSREGQIILWRVRDGHVERAFKRPHTDVVLGLALSPDGNYLASASADRLVKVFHTGDGRTAKAFPGHTHHVLGVSWNRTARTLASAGADKVIKIWDFVTGAQRRTIEAFDKHVTCIQYVGFTDQVLVSAADPRVSLFRETGEHVRTFPGPASYTFGIAATPDGRTIIAGGADGVLHVWDGEGAILARFSPPGDEAALSLHRQSRRSAE